MTFKLSPKSIKQLQGLEPDLIKVVESAIGYTKMDFSVIQGLRTQTQQNELYRQGLSHVKFSQHQLGRAVDVLAWIGKSSDSEDDLIQIAEAFKLAAEDMDVPIRWGGCWPCYDIRGSNIKWLRAMYLRQCRAEGREPFNDLPHYEIGVA